MAMKIITGYTNGKHITPADDAGLIKGILGDGDYVLDTGSKFEATIHSSNEIKIADGELVMQGRHARNDSAYEMVQLNNGIYGINRNDLIVARYTKDTDEVETISLVAIAGEATSETATDPDYNTGDIESGETRDFPLYRVRLEGVSIVAVEPLFNVWVLPISNGGTGANTSAMARQNMNYIGSNPIASPEEDTPAIWAAFKSGHSYTTTKNLLKQQPASYGFIENLTTNGTRVSQRFISNDGRIWYRTGTSTDGWDTNNGNIWTKMYDENNLTLKACMTGNNEEFDLPTMLGAMAVTKPYASTTDLLRANPERYGIECYKAGTVLVLSQLTVTNLNAGDVVTSGIVRYDNSSSEFVQYATSFANSGSGSTVHLLNQKMMTVDTHDVIQLVAANSTRTAGKVLADNRTSLTVIYLD